MKIYAAADIHGCPLRISKIQEQINSCRPDVLAIAGDVAQYFRKTDVFARLNEIGKPVIMVRGNTDLQWLEKRIRGHVNITLLQNNDFVFRDVRFAGLSGTIPVPFRSRIRLRERHVIRDFAPKVDPQTVLIVHSPPFGTLDKVIGRFHAGSQGIRGLIYQRRPAVCICGHIHEARGKQRLGDTMVVNCSMGNKGGVLITIKNNRKPRIDMSI